MAQPLPIVYVSSFSEAEGLQIDAGPRIVVLQRVESVSHARAMLSVLRAKGILREEHGDIANDIADDIAHPDSDSFTDSDSWTASDSDGECGGDLGGWGGWVHEHQEDTDIGHFLELAMSDVGSGNEGGGGADGAHHDLVVADGWTVDNAYQLARAVDLGIALEEVTAYIIPRLRVDAGDTVALRRLRILERAIRRVGKELPALMGQPPVTLGNFLQKVSGRALRRGTGAAAWMAARRTNVLVRAMGLLDDHHVALNFPA